MLTTVEKVLFLKSIELFRRIPGDDLARLSGITSEVAFENGELVFEAGEPGDALYLVIEGRVRVHRGERQIAELAERTCFGEMALLDGAPRSASVTCASEVVCLKIEREAFDEILAEKPEIAQGIIRVLSGRLRAALDEAEAGADPAA